MTQWTMGGQNQFNTRSNPFEHEISPKKVDRLAPKWTFAAPGDVSATPTVSGGAVYFPDWGGYLTKVDTKTGAKVWQRAISEYNGYPNGFSRTAPAVVGNVLYIGDQNARNYGANAHVFAIDTRTGDLIWSSVVDTHPLSVVTSSPVVYNGVVYVGVASKEEVASTLPNYPCCFFRGNVVALDQATGHMLWKTYTVPDNGGVPGGYSGNGVWGGTLAIDSVHNQLYATTGNNYTVPASVTACQDAGGDPEDCLAPDDYQDSVLALDMTTGRINWASGQKMFDQWTSACVPGYPPNNCPPNPGEDWDFGDGAHIFFVPQPDGQQRMVVGAGQKSGVYRAVDAVTGELVWTSAIGPGGVHGGMQWGTAVDDGRIYFADANSNHIPATLPNGETTSDGFFGALDTATGKLLWETVDPSHGEDPGAVSAVNGVMFAGSTSGHLFALDGETGKILWDYQAVGSSNAGPSIVDGTVYWGNGYRNIFYPRGLPGKRVYAFSIPEDEQ